MLMKAKLGMSPIAWWNDDLPELSDDGVARGMPAAIAQRRLYRQWKKGAASPTIQG